MADFAARPLQLAGEMVLHEGAAYLRLEQSAPPQAPVPAPDFDIKKPPTHADIERNVQRGAIQRHSSRDKETSVQYRVHVNNNIQKSWPLLPWQKKLRNRIPDLPLANTITSYCPVR